MTDNAMQTYPSNKYKQIIEDMLDKIKSGKWLPDFVIPSERELSETYGVNRITIRKAITYLKQQGYLYSEAKRGNYVLPSRSHDSNILYSFSDDTKYRGGVPGQKILEFGYVQLSELIRTNLQLPLVSKTVLRIKRLRFYDTTPMGIQISFLALNAEQTITQTELEDTGSLYTLLEDKFGIRMLEAYESVGARLPSPSERQYLEIGHDEVVLTSSRITYSSERKPAEYVEMIYPTSRFVYRMKINRDTFSY